MEEKFFDEKLSEDSYYLSYEKIKYCKYCGENLGQISGYCSDYCLEKDSVWNRV